MSVCSKNSKTTITEIRLLNLSLLLNPVITGKETIEGKKETRKQGNKTPQPYEYSLSVYPDNIH